MRRPGRYAWGYRAQWAQEKADHAARRPRAARLKQPGPLRQAVVEGLRQLWSPQQIALRLRRDHPDDPEMQVSHETIYQAFYVQSRGALRELLGREVLRTGRAGRLQRRVDDTGCRSGRRRLDLLRISARPAEVADRAVPGHWEGDLLIGARQASAIGTLVERSTRFVVLVALPDRARHDPARFADLAATAMLGLPEHLRRSLTWDRGLEMVNAHQAFTVKAGLPVYFCDPHSPWQRGSNENTNGLLRQYFPKGTSLARYTQADLDTVADSLNRRPRQTLGWDTPAERLQQLLVALAA
jgi:IS30 family transposase